MQELDAIRASAVIENRFLSLFRELTEKNGGKLVVNMGREHNLPPETPIVASAFFLAQEGVDQFIADAEQRRIRAYKSKGKIRVLGLAS